MSNKEKILNSFDDVLSDWLYYDRKECEDLPVGFIEECFKNGEVNIDEIQNHLMTKLEEVINE